MTLNCSTKIRLATICTKGHLAREATIAAREKNLAIAIARHEAELAAAREMEAEIKRTLQNKEQEIQTELKRTLQNKEQEIHAAFRQILFKVATKVVALNQAAGLKGDYFSLTSSIYSYIVMWQESHIKKYATFSNRLLGWCHVNHSSPKKVV